MWWEVTASWIFYFKSTDQENFDVGFDLWFGSDSPFKKSLSCMRFDSRYKIWLKLHDCPRGSLSHINFGMDLYVWFESANYKKKDPGQMGLGCDFDI